MGENIIKIKFSCLFFGEGGKDKDFLIKLIDLDKLKMDFPMTWKKEKNRLENQYSFFKIIWQFDNAEDEYMKVLGKISKCKYRLNELAKRKINKFINSDFWKRVLEPIIKKEKELKLKRNIN